MRKAKFGTFLSLTGAFILLSSCSPRIVEKIVVETRDSIITKIDTLPIELPPVYIKDYTALEDTLVLSTDYAEARAWVNPKLELLEGEIKSSPKTIKVPVPVTEEYHQRDSIQIKEVPVEVEKIREVVPKWAWWTLGWAVLSLIGIILYLYFKFKPF